ncbi:MAG: leucine-rich repeat protein [Clostridia bacterium]|nr:leucine-rich repeat protein [Clostridia bacterium]
MKRQRIYELMDGIREDFILEAEPTYLTTLQAPAEAADTAGGPRNIYAAAVTPPVSRPKPRPARRWMTAACLALAILVALPMCLGGLALSGGLLAPGGNASAIIGSEFFGKLFPFLSPDETDSTDTTHAPETEDPCANGHDWEITDTLEQVCYTSGYTERTCRNCGRSETEYTDPLPHTYENGACRVCGLIEGAAEDCTFRLDSVLLAATGEKGASVTRVNGNVQGELILPNVGYVKDYGLLPVTAVSTGILMSATDDTPAVTRVVFPDTVRIIGVSCLRDVSTVLEVVWPASLEEIHAKAFAGTGLTSLSLPEGVRLIDEMAFNGCASLTSVTIPAALETLGDEAFAGCVSLTELDLAHGGYTIGSAAFLGCTALETLVIPEGIDKPGDSAFAKCTSLSAVTLPDTMTDTGRYTFSGCSSLASVRLPDGITIGDGCFQECIAMTSITFPPNMGYIGSSAFARSGLIELIAEGNILGMDSGAFAYTQLTSVVIPGSLQGLNSAFTGTPLKELVVLGSCEKGGVGFEAFKNHPTLERVILPDGITSIYGSAFEGGTQLKEIRLPDSIDLIAETAFKGCTSLVSVHWPASLRTVRELAFEGCTSLRTVEVTHVTASQQTWERGVFKGCTALESMTVPKNVTEVEEWAFSNCRALTSVQLPHGLKRIGYDAFHNTGLASVEIPQTVIRIQNGAFEGSDLQEVTFLCSGALLEMGTNVFADCQKLESITLPNGKTYVEISTFEGCTSLREISFPSSMKAIGNSAFEGCTSLEILNLHSGITSISDTAFSKCPNLRVVTMDGENERYEVLNNCIVKDKKDGSIFLCTTEVVLTPDMGLTAIDGNAFSGRAIRSLVIPEGVTVIREGAFQNCTALENIHLPSTLTTIEKNAFSGCSALTSLEIPTSVRTIGRNAFYRCTALESITLPSATQVIERSALADCTALTTVRVPEGVVKLEAYVFSGCTNLERIYLSSTVSAFDEHVFSDCKALAEVYLEGNVKKWEIMINNSVQSNTDFTVYCKNGMIEPNGDVTLYE